MSQETSSYQKAFRHYLRSGTSIEFQLKARESSFEVIWRDKYRQSSKLARELVERRIHEIRQAIEAGGGELPDVEAPDTAILEAEFQQTYKDMLESYRDDMGNASVEKFSRRLDGAQDLLSDRFRQQLDPVLQPHYGIEHFVWSGGGADPCANCAAHQGQIGTWGASPAPPGCDYCRCYAAPYLKALPESEYPDAIEPVYPEFLLLPVLRIGRGAWTLAQRVVGRHAQKIPSQDKPKNLTGHGAVRWAERKITEREVQEAMKNARESGNITSRMGKYGTLQHRFHGRNGVTVVMEAEGRNAGKIITYWRN